MFNTVQQMFDAMLVGINKEQTGTITPDEFEFAINEAALEVMVDRYDLVEYNQKRIDDLRIFKARDIVLNTGSNIAGQEIFNLPYNAQNFVVTPGNPSGFNNGYVFMLNCGFQIYYKDNVCGKTGKSQGYLKAKPMRSDRELEIANDPYNKPKDERLYYEIIGDKIRLITGTNSYGLSCQITYLRYPRFMILADPNSCEFPLHIRKEIVDVAVRKKLLRIQSESYQANVADNNLSFK